MRSKRQVGAVVAAVVNGAYIAPKSLTTNICLDATKYQLNGTRLNDLTSGVGVSANLAAAPYVSLNDPVAGGSITTSFTIEGNVLVWSNSQFFNGRAGFCELKDVVYATFTAAGGPAGCVPVQIVVVSCE